MRVYVAASVALGLYISECFNKNGVRCVCVSGIIRLSTYLVVLLDVSNVCPACSIISAVAFTFACCILLFCAERQKSHFAVVVLAVIGYY